MRVITGLARGRKLFEPLGSDIRPTTDMVKEAIFNIIQFDVPGRKVLDLFAGTGQLGIEALSRGAASAVFVDADGNACRLILQNLDHCDFEAKVQRSDALAYLESCGKFDLIFIDPPYSSDLAQRALEKIYQFDILEEGGIIVCESGRDSQLAPPPAGYGAKEYRYGRVKLTVISREGQAL